MLDGLYMPIFCVLVGFWRLRRLHQQKHEVLDQLTDNLSEGQGWQLGLGQI